MILHPQTSNAIVYFLTNSLPLMTLLKQLSQLRTGSVLFPQQLNGIQLTFFNSLPKTEEKESYLLSDVPSYFWRSRTIWKLPSSKTFRKRLCREVCDSDHNEHCNAQPFHPAFLSHCECVYCGGLLHPYHISYDLCPEFCRDFAADH